MENASGVAELSMRMGHAQGVDSFAPNMQHAEGVAEYVPRMANAVAVQELNMRMGNAQGVEAFMPQMQHAQVIKNAVQKFSARDDKYFVGFVLTLFNRACKSTSRNCRTPRPCKSSTCAWGTLRASRPLCRICSMLRYGVCAKGLWFKGSRRKDSRQEGGTNFRGRMRGGSCLPTYPHR